MLDVRSDKKGQRMRFNIGDRVRAVSAFYGGFEQVEGDIGVIVEYSSPVYRVDFPRVTYWSALETDLVLADKPKKPLNVDTTINESLREKSAVRAIETIKGSNFGLTALKVEFEAHFGRSWSDKKCYEYIMEKLSVLGLAELKTTLHNVEHYTSLWHPVKPLVFAKFYNDGSVDSEFTLTLLMDKAENVLLLPKIMDAFTSLGPAMNCNMTTKRAGLHIALIKAKNGHYSPSDIPTAIDKKRFKNFQRSMTMLLPALYFLGSQNKDNQTRSMYHRQPKIGSGQIDGYGPSNPKYSAVSYRGTALEFRVFDTCYDNPQQILDNVVVMKNAIRYWRKDYRSPNLHKICEKVKFGIYSDSAPVKLDNLFVTAEHIDLLNAGLRLLKPNYYTVRQLKAIKDFRVSKRGMVAKLKEAKEKAIQDYKEYEERFQWRCLVQANYIRADKLSVYADTTPKDVIISADKKEVLKEIEKEVKEYVKNEEKNKVSLQTYIAQKIEASYGGRAGYWQLTESGA